VNEVLGIVSELELENIKLRERLAGFQ
jgi:hypothetical protein